MLRPLPLDVAAAVAPLLAGAAAFLLGRRLPRWRPSLQRAAVAVVVLPVALAAASLFAPLPDPLPRLLSRLGGGTVVLAVVVLFALGAARGTPGVRFSPRFLGVQAAVAGLLLAVEGSGRLGWRFLAPDAWTRAPAADGTLRQSSGLTCSPTAAVMLLHAAGVPSTEGEMAYLAGTSVFGTDAWAVADAITARLAGTGLRAEVGSVGFDDVVRDGRPFVAHVHRPGIGGHAVYVEAVTGDEVRFVDPLDGGRHRVPAAAFRAEWDGTVVRLTGE